MSEISEQEARECAGIDDQKILCQGCIYDIPEDCAAREPITGKFPDGNCYKAAWAYCGKRNNGVPCSLPKGTTCPDCGPLP